MFTEPQVSHTPTRCPKMSQQIAPDETALHSTPLEFIIRHGSFSLMWQWFGFLKRLR